MRVRLLGTAATDGHPDPFCAGDNCRGAWPVDDDLPTDLGPDVVSAVQALGSALMGPWYCLQAHEHEDHPHHARFLAHSHTTGVLDVPRLHCCVARSVLDRIRQTPSKADLRIVAGQGEALDLTPRAIAPSAPFDMGAYRVTALAPRALIERGPMRCPTRPTPGHPSKTPLKRCSGGMGGST
jgi:hypothetical protein